MIRLQYPAIEDTDKGALTALKTALDDARPDSSCRSRPAATSTSRSKRPR
ncbi:MAG: hypothetical protein R2734_06865 [Nocardioides sp.]